MEIPGPAVYTIKASSTAPCFSMGSRFDSDVRSKDHIKPRKVDGPGPGSYVLPGAIRITNTTSSQLSKKAEKKSTFGMSGRDAGMSKTTPAPNAYYPSKFTEATHHYSFPKAEREDKKIKQASFTPGPWAYEIRRDDKQEGTAKSFLGGPLEQKVNLDNGVPGPGYYKPAVLQSIPGFRIVPHEQRKREDQSLDDKG